MSFSEHADLRLYSWQGKKPLFIRTTYYLLLFTLSWRFRTPPSNYTPPGAAGSRALAGPLPWPILSLRRYMKPRPCHIITHNYNLNVLTIIGRKIRKARLAQLQQQGGGGGQGPSQEQQRQWAPYLNIHFSLLRTKFNISVMHLYVQVRILTCYKLPQTTRRYVLIPLSWTYDLSRPPRRCNNTPLYNFAHT